MQKASAYLPNGLSATGRRATGCPRARAHGFLVAPLREQSIFAELHSKPGEIFDHVGASASIGAACAGIGGLARLLLATLGQASRCASPWGQRKTVCDA